MPQDAKVLSEETRHATPGKEQGQHRVVPPLFHLIAVRLRLRDLGVRKTGLRLQSELV